MMLMQDPPYTGNGMSNNNPPQVTSRGCSRAFICFLLYRALIYVQQLRKHDYAVFFPFPTQFIEEWLKLAQHDCENALEYQHLLGGTSVLVEDPSTYWTQPQQFFTW